RAIVAGMEMVSKLFPEVRVRRADQALRRIARATETALANEAIETRNPAGPVPRSFVRTHRRTRPVPTRQINLARVALILRHNRTNTYAVRGSFRVCSTQPRSDDHAHPFRLPLKSQRPIEFRLVIGDEIHMLPI